MSIRTFGGGIPAVPAITALNVGVPPNFGTSTPGEVKIADPTVNDLGAVILGDGLRSSNFTAVYRTAGGALTLGAFSDIIFCASGVGLYGQTERARISGTTGDLTVTGGLLPALPAKGTGRNLIVRLSGDYTLNLNAVQANTLFTTPATGFSKCVVTKIVLTSFGGACTTNAVSFGSSGTPNDWLAATVLPGTTGATTAVTFRPALNVSVAFYSTNVAFVANVTVGGAAIFCNVDVFGYYA